MGFASERLDIAPSCEERMLGSESLLLLGEAGIFLTGLPDIQTSWITISSTAIAPSSIS